MSGVVSPLFDVRRELFTGAVFARFGTNSACVVRIMAAPTLSPPASDTASALASTAGGVRVGLSKQLIRTVVHLLQTACGVVVGAVLVHELQTSALEARLFSEYAARLSYVVQRGPASRTAFPHSGPFDFRRGYARLAAFQSRLAAHGFRVQRQAQVSPELAQLAAWGVNPPYPERPVVGLTLHGKGKSVLFSAARRDRTFQRFADVPPLLVDTLLFMENRELLKPFDPRSNPVIEWDRLAKASLLYVGRAVRLPVPLQGGSTLATQLEKYRHSPAGRTASATEKLRQLVAASLRAYADGPDTRARRQQIVVDYLNTLPLAAAPGYGELYGLGDGLYAWFGLRFQHVRRALAAPGLTADKVHVFKHVLALLTAVRAPTRYLLESRSELEAKVNDYTALLAKAGVIDGAFAKALQATHISFRLRAPVPPPTSFVQHKAANAMRTTLLRLLGVSSLYELDRLDLEVDSPIDVVMQRDVARLFQNLADPRFVAANGLKAKRLLRTGDPEKVIYSLMLFERTAAGNLLRVQTDNLDRPFDINDGIKMELGSTAKLRTLAHYLELVAGLYHELSPLDAPTLAERARNARDPITAWAAKTLQNKRDVDLDGFLQQALDRRYSASPYESFFTGGGVHTFGNFEPEDNGRVLSVRTGLQNSVNLVFIRLMRDLVRFHEARLSYDAAALLADVDNPDRQRLLEEIAQRESEHFLNQAYRKYRGLSADAVIDQLLGKRQSPQRLAMVFFAWHRGADEAGLAQWLAPRLGELPPAKLHRLFHAYGNPRLNLADYGYLLSRHPEDVWCAGQVVREPAVSWDELVHRSSEVRQAAGAWLFQSRNRRAQDVRLRIGIERDAFARMTPYWQKLGFPFARLVPTYATAIGNSSDRPAALAELMGIIVNDGVRRPTLRLTQLAFAQKTPYQTVFEPDADPGERVMEPEVAGALRGVLADVVAGGTARRVAGAFLQDGKPIVVGGKTGSGDNRFKTFRRHGGVVSSRPVNRTATFVFYIGDRYFGVLTAFVPGKEAGNYEFTSSLPLAVLKLAAPVINARLHTPKGGAAVTPAVLRKTSAPQASASADNERTGAERKSTNARKGCMKSRCHS
jgi:membrane peptidoglycan carboxypeptidase